MAHIIETHRNQVKDYLILMEKASLIFQLQSKTEGRKALEKTEKVYLGNPNLIYALTAENSNIGNMRETFFAYQTAVNNAVTAAEKSDFRIGDSSFEVGGKKKTQKQLEGLKNTFIVKDD